MGGGGARMMKVVNGRAGFDIQRAGFVLRWDGHGTAQGTGDGWEYLEL